MASRAATKSFATVVNSPGMPLSSKLFGA
jgi:hypothetical protein